VGRTRTVIGQLPSHGVGGNLADAWHSRRYKNVMRKFLTFLVFAVLGLLYLYQKQHESAPAESLQSVATVNAKPTPAAVLTPAPRGQASEYNYMKRALDRAATVRDQAQSQTQAAQDP
jgi:hypothetical protein